MQVVDLSPEHERVYFVCLEDWSDEVKEAGDHKEQWYREMTLKGLRVKLALDDNGQPGGMIEYLPIEQSHAEGSDLNLITCIWVHGHKKGRGDYRKHGMGTALLEAAEEDTWAKGRKGLAAFGLFLPFWIPSGWFKKHGYKKVDSRDGIQLLWKPFSEDAQPPSWIRRKYAPEAVPGKVVVTSLLSRQCIAGNIVHERARRAAAELGDRVEFRTIRIDGRDAVRQYGAWGALYVDGKKVRTGPPPSYEKIHRVIEGRVKKLA